MNKELGEFSLYQPAPDFEAARGFAIYLQNAAGEDWYDLANSLDEEMHVAVIANGEVQSFNNNPSDAWPEGALAVATTETIEGRTRYADGVFSKIAEVLEMPPLTPRQFALMLWQIDMSWDQLAAYIGATKPTDEIPVPPFSDPALRQRALIEFEKAGLFERSHWAVDPIATQLGFTPEEMNTMWLYASDL